MKRRCGEGKARRVVWSRHTGPDKGGTIRCQDDRLGQVIVRTNVGSLGLDIVHMTGFVIGIGADGLLIVRITADITAIIYNSDTLELSSVSGLSGPHRQSWVVHMVHVIVVWPRKRKLKQKGCCLATHYG